MDIIIDLGRSSFQQYYCNCEKDLINIIRDCIKLSLNRPYEKYTISSHIKDDFTCLSSICSGRVFTDHGYELYNESYEKLVINIYNKLLHKC